MYFRCYYYRLEIDVALHSKNLNSLLPKNDLCQIWMELAEQFLRRKQNCEMLTEINVRQKTTFDQNSSFELSVKVS